MKKINKLKIINRKLLPFVAEQVSGSPRNADGQLPRLVAFRYVRDCLSGDGLSSVRFPPAHTRYLNRSRWEHLRPYFCHSQKSLARTAAVWLFSFLCKRPFLHFLCEEKKKTIHDRQHNILVQTSSLYENLSRL